MFVRDMDAGEAAPPVHVILKASTTSLGISHVAEIDVTLKIPSESSMTGKEETKNKRTKKHTVKNESIIILVKQKIMKYVMTDSYYTCI